MGLSDSRPRLPEVISFLAELGRASAPSLPGLPGSSADLFTRAVPFHPGKLGECSHPLLLRRFLASSVSADWPLPLLSRGRFRVRLHYSSRVCRTGLRLSELLLQTPVWLHVERVIHMMISFQITRSARLFLAHRNRANPRSGPLYGALTSGVSVAGGWIAGFGVVPGLALVSVSWGWKNK